MGVALRIWNLGILDGEAGQVVLGMMFNKETTAMGRIHVCPANVAPCEDPECQMVVSIGREGSGNFLRGHRQRACPGRTPFGHGEVERSPLVRVP